MARRRGNKKRRDIERDSTTFRRIAKVGAVTAGVIAGGAAFRSSNIGKRLASSGLTEAAIKSARGFKKDITNKPMNIRTLKNAYDKNIGKNGKLIKEQADKIKNNKKLDLKNTKFVKDLHVSKQLKERVLYEGRKEEHAKRKQEFIKQMINAHKLEGKSKDKFVDVVNSAYHHLTKENMEDGTAYRLLKTKLDKAGISNTNANELFRSIVQFKEDNLIDNDSIKEMYGELAEHLSSLKLNNIKHDTNSGLLNSIDKKLGTNFENKILGNRAATLGDLDRMGLLEESDFGKQIIKKFLPEDGEKRNTQLIDYNKEIKNLLAQNEEFRNVVIDKGLRVGLNENGSEILIDNREAFGVLENIKKAIYETVPGKILMKNYDLGDKKSIGFLHSGTRDVNAFLTGAEDNIMDSMMFYMDGKLYGTTINADGKASLNGIVENVKQVTGWRTKIVHDMLGTGQQPAEAYENKWFKKLDINQDGESNLPKRISRMFNRYADPDYERNELIRTKEMLTDGIESVLQKTMLEIQSENPDMSQEELLSAAKIRMHKANNTTSIFLNKNITSVSDELLDIVMQNDEVGDREKHLLGLLQSGKQEDVNQFLLEVGLNNNGQIDLESISNKKLRSLVEMTYKDAEKAQDISHVSITERKTNIFLGMPLNEQWTRNQTGQLRVEMLKEIMIKQDELNSPEPDKIMNWIHSLDTTVEQNDILEKIGVLGIFENYMNIGLDVFDNEIGKRFNLGGSESRLYDLLEDNGLLKNTFSNTMDNLIKGFSKTTNDYMDSINQVNFYNEYNDIALIRKSKFTPMQLIENINNFIKTGEKDELLNTFKEFNAGRNDTKNITDVTLQLQNSISRLNYSLNEFGLGLSSESMGSPLQTYLSFATKRVLPVAIGLKTFEYLNDESRRFLGSSITEAGARGLSYMDIGARKALYSVGIGDMINSWAEASVIHEYAFGSNKFENAEEREDWYEKGYSPMRKGRYWNFGSSSEIRGSNITYWQPNYLRRLESNYKDVSIYGSSEEKWAHSWIPTPTHPFSTLRAAMNPYWLEKKHLKENDRPYPLTAKMFSEGTPWGAILNPTIGEILKPVRMLPEARKRLGKDGEDINSVLERINTRIKSKGKDGRDNDLLIINGSDIRNGEYVPYGNPEPSEVNISIRNGNIQVPGISYMDKLQDIREYEAPTGNDYVSNGYGNSAGKVITSAVSESGVRSVLEKGTVKLMEGAVNHGTGYSISNTIINNVNNFIKSNKKNKGIGYRNISSINNAPSKKTGTYVYHNLINEYNNYLDGYYNRQNINMINHSLQSDYLKDAMYSTSQISGMYGYLAGLLTDSGNTYTYRYENAGQMSSFKRGFWDANIGGLGFGPMEIARRFFPSEDRSRININPLRNNMPDWIVNANEELYGYGDPYTKIPKGEMRLPGKGYETLNQLHSDAYGDYGSFDRFKILADIAPNSTEYKKWKNIAKATVTDPKLKKEMDDILERTSKMSGSHEFYEYKFIKNKTKYHDGIVKYIDEDSNIHLVDDTVLKLAGIKPKEGANYDVLEMIAPGAKITYRTNRSREFDIEKDNKFLSAIVYEKGKSESINKTLLDSNRATKDVEDNSTLGQLAKLSPSQEFFGGIQEYIAHAPIPIVHNKFLKVETAYESYMNETYYGSNFKTWDHPIKGFVKPMFNQQSGKSLLSEALSIGVAYHHFKYVLGGKPNERGPIIELIEKATKKSVSQKFARRVSNVALSMTNPTAFLGGNIGFITKMGLGSSGKGSELNNWQKGAKYGTIIGTMKYAWDNADNPFKSAATMATAGFILGGQTNFGWELLEKSIGKMNARKGALIGTAIGLTMSAIKNPSMDKQKMFGKWTPKDTRKKWDLDEYFDRLTYIKYSGLYREAARRASLLEHTDIKGLFKDIDKNKKKIGKINIKIAELSKKQKTGYDKYAQKIEELENKKMYLEEQSAMFYKGGKYTEAAVAYKKKMESTMYGMTNAASKDEILASVPQQYKDFYAAFVDETDEKERKKILKSMSPMMRRPLQAAWGMKLEDVQSNRKYFGIHAMPKSGWRGWKPNVNIKHVKMKTIQNEGMLLSEFGYYDSEKSNATYEMAPDIEHYDQGSGIGRMHELKQALRGSGLHFQNVSVQQTSAPGTWIFSDVKQKTNDYKKVAGYKINNVLSSLF